MSKDTKGYAGGSQTWIRTRSFKKRGLPGSHPLIESVVSRGREVVLKSSPVDSVVEQSLGIVGQWRRAERYHSH